MHLVILVLEPFLILPRALLEKEMATHSSILAWKTHGWRNLVGYSQSMGFLRVGHD